MKYIIIHKRAKRGAYMEVLIVLMALLAMSIGAVSLLLAFQLL